MHMVHAIGMCKQHGRSAQDWCGCRYGVGSKAVAGAVTEGVKQVYWVADGAEGPRGWKVLRTNTSCQYQLHVLYNITKFKC